MSNNGDGGKAALSSRSEGSNVNRNCGDDDDDAGTDRDDDKGEGLVPEGMEEKHGDATTSKTSAASVPLITLITMDFYLN